jgi:putative ABC transport system substrate-binding protein
LKNTQRKEVKMKNLMLSKSLIVLVIVIITGLLLVACGGAAQKPFTIGVVSESVNAAAPVGTYYKDGLTELGYVEGEDVTYIDNGPVGSNSAAADAELKKLLAQKVDMLLVIGPIPAQQAKQAVAGTDVPVIFTPMPQRAVEFGLVESISHPGGNLTGVQGGNEVPETLKWLVKIKPNARKIYVPYSPDDEISIGMLAALEEIAPQLNIELVRGEAKSAEEAVAAVENLPADIDAIFFIPAPTLESKISELSQTAIKRGLPTGTFIPKLDETILVTVSFDPIETGKQVARLIHQVRQGIKPADLPVETVETYLTINLKTANAIGLEIPNEILRQADMVIR